MKVKELKEILKDIDDEAYVKITKGVNDIRYSDDPTDCTMSFWIDGKPILDKQMAVRADSDRCK